MNDLECARRSGALRPLRFDLQRFAGDRVLPATQRQRQRARERGSVARSADFSGGLALLAAAGALAVVGPAGVEAYGTWAAGVWGNLPSAPLAAGGAVALGLAGLHQAAGVVVPVLGAALALGTLVAAAQTGFLFSGAALAPKFERIDPSQGLRRIFSRRAGVEFVKSLIKVGAVLAVAWGPATRLVIALASGAATLPQAAHLTFTAVVGVCLRAAVVLAVIGAADYFYQRYEHDQTLRMTRQQVRDEGRETEGDPLLRSARRRRQRELARRRMLADVRLADVVLANPTHVAVALRYDPEQMAAPTVVAKGVASMAERIKAVARSAGVPVVENPPLARALHQGVVVGRQVPAALYQAVAEVLAFVWRVRGRA